MHSRTKYQVNISNHSEKKVAPTQYLAKFQAGVSGENQIAKPNGCKLSKNHWTGAKCKLDL
jgi:hypothetical protein